MSRQPIFKTEWQCMSSTQIILHAGVNGQSWLNNMTMKCGDKKQKKMKTAAHFLNWKVHIAIRHRFWVCTRFVMLCLSRYVLVICLLYMLQRTSEKHQSTCYLAAKHPNHNKLRVSGIREKFSEFFFGCH